MKVIQSCPILCNPMDCSLPGYSVHGILQARILEWVAISSFGDLPDPGIKPRSSSLQANSLLSEPSGKPVMSDSLQPYGLKPSRLLCQWDYPGKNTGVDCCFLLQGIFPTQRMNPGLLRLLHWKADSSPLSHLGSTMEYYSAIKKNKIMPFTATWTDLSSVQSLSSVQLFATPWTAAHQVSLSITNS